MKITPIASELFGILASVVKMSRDYMAYIDGCVSKSHIVKLPGSKRLDCLELGLGHTSLFIQSTSSIYM